MSCLLAVAVSLVVAGCGRQPAYSHFLPVGPDGWDRADTLHFLVPVAATGCYQASVNLRTTTFYPYTQLALTVSTAVRHGKSRHRPDSVAAPLLVDAPAPFELAFPVTSGTGTPQGRGISIRQHAQRLGSPLMLDSGDTLAFSVAHAMRCRLLAGIVDVGVALTEVPCSGGRPKQGK